MNRLDKAKNLNIRNIFHDFFKMKRGRIEDERRISTELSRRVIAFN